MLTKKTPVTQSVQAFPPLRRRTPDTLQVNLGYRCNQACSHCHVDAGPNRTEEMQGETIDDILDYIDSSAVRTLDITGGAPELNPHFRRLVRSARERGLRVIDRCNLTVLNLPHQADLAEFLARQGVEITASLPCYLEDNVDRQRGKGVFAGSLDALRRLNALGYGTAGSARILNLVYNPQGPHLPPSQPDLEQAYRERLTMELGIAFTRLLVITNMPIARFRHALERNNQLSDYLGLLIQSHDPVNLQNVMCRTLLSVDWRGFVYDCDFNQMMGIPLSCGGRARVRLRELMDIDLTANPIAVAEHCFGCTAGQGSSCGGALT